MVRAFGVQGRFRDRLTAHGSQRPRVGPRPVVLAGMLLCALGTLPFTLTHPAAALLPVAVGGFSSAFLWSTAFTFLAALVGLGPPARVAAARTPS